MIPMQAVTPEDVDSVKNNKELKHLLKERAVKLYEGEGDGVP